MTLLETLQALPSATAEIALDGASIRPVLTAKEFSTGSKGFAYQGKVDGADGRRYQLNVQAVVIGSKDQA